MWAWGSLSKLLLRVCYPPSQRERNMTSLRQPSWAMALLLVALSLLPGCAAYDPSGLAASGPGSDVAASEATTFREAQDALIIQLAKAAQPPADATTKLANEVDKSGANVTFIMKDKVTW